MGSSGAVFATVGAVRAAQHQFGVCLSLGFVGLAPVYTRCLDDFFAVMSAIVDGFGEGDVCDGDAGRPTITSDILRRCGVVGAACLAGVSGVSAGAGVGASGGPAGTGVSSNLPSEVLSSGKCVGWFKVGVSVRLWSGRCLGGLWSVGGGSAVGFAVVSPERLLSCGVAFCVCV